MENNIPVVSVNQVLNSLVRLYTKGTPEAYRKSPFLWGPPGIGKSECVMELAEALEKKTGKKVIVTKVNLVTIPVTDIIGIPVKSPDGKNTIWLRPEIFKMDESKDVINILFMDELTAASENKQEIACQLFQERTAGVHRLAGNCIMIGAGNRVTDKSVAYRMPSALANRLMHFEVQADFDSWRIWGINHGINKHVLGYLSFDHSKLYQAEIDYDDKAYPTPRSWGNVSELMNMFEDETPEQLHDMIAGYIGVGTALEFEAWCQLSEALPPVEKIFKGEEVHYPRTPDALYTVVSSMTTYISRKRLTITSFSLENACAYALRFPVDYAALFFRNMLAVEDLRMKLYKCPAFMKWMRKNKKYVEGL